MCGLHLGNMEKRALETYVAGLISLTSSCHSRLRSGISADGFCSRRLAYSRLGDYERAIQDSFGFAMKCVCSAFTRASARSSSDAS